MSTIENLSILGEGAFGIVEAINTLHGTVAKKTLKLSNDESENNKLRRRFKREVEYQATCKHRNIVPILSHDLELLSPSFTMPLAICSLAQESELSIHDKINIAYMLMDGVEYIHSLGHIHRDLKPQNILKFHAIGGFYYAISDFGLIANKNNENTTILTETSIAMGTEAYMAPECYLDAKSATHLSDIYSLGVILKFLFDDKQIGLPYSERFSDSIIGNIIRTCTKKESTERYQSINELRTDFQNTIQTLEIIND